MLSRLHTGAARHILSQPLAMWFRGMATMGRGRAIETPGRKIGRRFKPPRDKAFEPIERSWHHIDGHGHVLGRLASKIVPLLIGKHKPIYQPQRDVGDYGESREWECAARRACVSLRRARVRES